MEASNPPTLSAWRTGFQGRCPRCGEGRLYSSFLKIAETCGVCGLDMSKEDAGDGAVPFIILIVGAIGVGLGAWVMFTFETGVLAPILVAVPVSIILTLVLMPKVKGLLVALQYLHRAGDTGLNTFDAED